MAYRPLRRTHSGGFTLVELLVVIAIIGILVALLLPAVQAARESARRTQCRSNLREVGLALQNYHDVRGHFPAGRNRSDQFGVSWAFELLPHLEQQSVYDAYVQGDRVDSQVNAGAMRTPIPVYYCPSRRSPAADRDFDDDDEPSQVRGVATAGDYAANAGLEEDIGMEGNDFVDGKIDLTLAGPLFSGSQIKMRQVTDGLSNTIAVGDKHIRPVRADWTAGTEHRLQGDSCFLAADSLTTIMRGTEDGLADGPDDNDDEVFGSEHPNVVQFVFLDGHVESLSRDSKLTAVGVNPEQVEDIHIDEEWLWLGALSTVAGSETLQQ
jgi:prepilin-type N-terminal cleavage/methylation domain-containing protein/prepilin-type processing-associated H-X9-DG protein